MVNLRRSLEFRYYSREKNCLGNYSFVAKSTIVQPFNYNAPEQIHLAYGDRIDQIFVSYVTNSSQYIHKCHYGLNPLSLRWRAQGTTTTYKASDMCEGKANIPDPQTFIDPGYMHMIMLENIRPSTTYFYRAGNDQHGWPSILSFTNRPTDDANAKVNIIVYGDRGAAPIHLGAKSAMDRIRAHLMVDNITCVLHMGDIRYARGIGALWDAFMTQIGPVASRVPYMVAIGNHEYDHVTGGDKDPSRAPGPGGFRPSRGNYGYDSDGECAVPMVHRFRSPSNDNGLFWYSFDVGPVHVLCYSMEHDFLPLSLQYAWIERELSSVDRSHTPWIIVESHRHMYSSIVRDVGDPLRAMLQKSLQPIFYTYHVDINLFRHIHSYERSCRMYQEKCVDNDIVHVLVGMGGHKLDFDTYTE